MLRTLDRFAQEFALTPGVNKVLAPLAKGIWKHDDPEFWSVLAHAYVSLLLRDRGFLVKAFSALMLGGPKDADILVGLGSGDIYVDIVMKHRPRFRNVAEAREELHRHADEKIGTKFAKAIEGGLQVFVIVVCVVQAQQISVLNEDPGILAVVDGTVLNRSSSVKGAFFAMTGSRQDGLLSWRLFSRDEWVAAAKT